MAKRTAQTIARVGFKNREVAAVFRAYPQPTRTKLLLLRELIFDTARSIAAVGELEETLKWGQPSYLTKKSKSGTTVRIDSIKSCPGDYAIYFHCQTTLVDTFKQTFGDRFRYEGNRSIVFADKDKVPITVLRHCIAMALTYHRNKASGARKR